MPNGIRTKGTAYPRTLTIPAKPPGYGYPVPFTTDKHSRKQGAWWFPGALNPKTTARKCRNYARSLGSLGKIAWKTYCT